jgi:hypothetical protein
MPLKERQLSQRCGIDRHQAAGYGSGFGYDCARDQHINQPAAQFVCRRMMPKGDECTLQQA